MSDGSGQLKVTKGHLNWLKAKNLTLKRLMLFREKLKMLRVMRQISTLLLLQASTYDGIPIEVTDATFDSIVLRSKTPIVVDFTAEW